MNTGADLTTAFIDLITGIIGVIEFIILTFNKENSVIKNKWKYFLLALGLANVGGFIVHAFIYKEVVFDILWIFMYLAMYFIVIMFSKVSLYKVFKDKYPTPKQNIIFYIISLICYIASCIIGFFTINEIRVFVLYAAIIALPCFVLMFINDLKNKNKSSILIIIVIILQAIGLYFQITKTGYFKFVGEFNHDGIYHIGLLITVILLYFVCIIDMENENYKN